MEYTISDFAIGDRVEMVNSSICDANRPANGTTGTVIRIGKPERALLGVRWDERIRAGHDLSGACESGFGWWVPAAACVPEAEPEVTPQSADALFSMLGL